MNKAQLIEAIASEANISKVDAKRAIDAFISVTGDALKKGDKIALVGFGAFYASKRPERQGRDPRTGAKIRIPSRSVAKFRAGTELTAKLN